MLAKRPGNDDDGHCARERFAAQGCGQHIAHRQQSVTENNILDANRSAFEPALTRGRWGHLPSKALTAWLCLTLLAVGCSDGDDTSEDAFSATAQDVTVAQDTAGADTIGPQDVADTAAPNSQKDVVADVWSPDTVATQDSVDSGTARAQDVISQDHGEDGQPLHDADAEPTDGAPSLKDTDDDSAQVDAGATQDSAPDVTLGPQDTVDNDATTITDSAAAADASHAADAVVDAGPLPCPDPDAKISFADAGKFLGKASLGPVKWPTAQPHTWPKAAFTEITGQYIGTLSSPTMLVR